MKKQPLKKKTDNLPKKNKINPKAIAQERKSLLESITGDLESKGLPSITPSEQGGVLNIDDTYLTLPRDLTEIPSRLLGNYLNAYTQNRMYLRTLIGWQELQVEDSKRVYYDKFAPVYEDLCRQKMSETSKELLVNNHPNVKDVFIAFRDERQKLNMLNYTLASIEDAIFLISREISRRSTDFSTENRNENVARR